MADIPLRTAYPFVKALNTVPVPIAVPEDNASWTVISDLQNSGLPNGLYFINGGITFTPTSTSKSALFRVVENGVAGASIIIESKDVSDVIYIPFNTDVEITDGTINVQVEAQCEEGQGGGGIDIQSTLLFYERKL